MWNSLLREVFHSQELGISKSNWATCCDLKLVLLWKGVGLETSWGPFQTKLSCKSMFLSSTCYYILVIVNTYILQYSIITTQTSVFTKMCKNTSVSPTQLNMTTGSTCCQMLGDVYFSVWQTITRSLSQDVNACKSTRRQQKNLLISLFVLAMKH